MRTGQPEGLEGDETPAQAPDASGRAAALLERARALWPPIHLALALLLLPSLLTLHSQVGKRRIDFYIGDWRAPLYIPWLYLCIGLCLLIIVGRGTQLLLMLLKRWRTTHVADAPAGH